LKSLVGCNLWDRYQNLLQFYKSHPAFKEEAEWLRKRLTAVSNFSE
jgi:hypothetical protein